MQHRGGHFGCFFRPGAALAAAAAATGTLAGKQQKGLLIHRHRCLLPQQLAHPDKDPRGQLQPHLGHPHLTPAAHIDPGAGQRQASQTAHQKAGQGHQLRPVRQPQQQTAGQQMPDQATGGVIISGK